MEIEALHDFFVAYYTGERTDFSRFPAALAADFEMVTPGGSCLDREAVLELVEKRGDTYDPGEFDIEIRDSRIIDSGPGYALARYEEHQTTPDERTARLSTVLLHVDEGAPGGLSWVSVHETWLADAGQ